MNRLRSVAAAFRAFHSAAIVAFHGGRDSAAMLARTDDDAAPADRYIHITITPLATKTVAVAITADLDIEIDLRHLQVVRLRGRGRNERWCAREHRHRGREENHHFAHALLLFGYYGQPPSADKVPPRAGFCRNFGNAGRNGT
jgi:hypothetical protein